MAETHIAVSIADITIRDAKQYVVDGDAYYLEHMPAIIERFQITYAEFWGMSVAEFQVFVEYMTGGVPDGEEH